MWKFLQPARHKPELPAEKVDKEYSRLRRQVFWGIFIGYAGYYLVRKNFSIAMPALESMGYDKADLGWALSAVSIAYGISKFVMGTVSDRSNARVFIPLGLIASALIMIFMGVLAVGVDLDSRRHHGDVLPAVRQRLDAGHGLAPLRACHDALVLHQGTRREDVGVERGAQHRRSGDGSARRIRYYAGVHAFRRPAGRRFLCSGTRRAGDRRNRLSHGARYAAIVRPPAHRDLETRNQAILRLEREGDDRAADSIRKCIE